MNSERAQCILCEMSFVAASKLSRHYARYHCPKNYRCPLCSQKYIYERNLWRHFNKMHPNMNLNSFKSKEAYEVSIEKDAKKGEEIATIVLNRKKNINIREGLSYTGTDSFILVRRKQEQDWISRGDNLNQS